MNKDADTDDWKEVFAVEVGISDLPREEQDKAAEAFGRSVFESSYRALWDACPLRMRDEFKKLMERKDMDSDVVHFVQEHIPNAARIFKKMIDEQMSRLVAEKDIVL